MALLRESHRLLRKIFRVLLAAMLTLAVQACRGSNDPPGYDVMYGPPPIEDQAPEYGPPPAAANTVITEDAGSDEEDTK